MVLQGNYFYYQLTPGNSQGYGYMQTLTIQLETLVGDADLIVSTTNPFPVI